MHRFVRETRAHSRPVDNDKLIEMLESEETLLWLHTQTGASRTSARIAVVWFLETFNPRAHPDGVDGQYQRALLTLVNRLNTHGNNITGAYTPRHIPFDTPTPRAMYTQATTTTQAIKHMTPGVGVFRRLFDTQRPQAIPHFMRR